MQGPRSFFQEYRACVSASFRVRKARCDILKFLLLSSHIFPSKLIHEVFHLSLADRLTHSHIIFIIDNSNQDHKR